MTSRSGRKCQKLCLATFEKILNGHFLTQKCSQCTVCTFYMSCRLGRKTKSILQSNCFISFLSLVDIHTTYFTKNIFDCAFRKASTIKAGAEVSATNAKANGEHNHDSEWFDGHEFRRDSEKTDTLDLDAHSYKEVKCLYFSLKSIFQIQWG